MNKMNSLEIYKIACSSSQTQPPTSYYNQEQNFGNFDADSYYLLIVTTAFYELVTVRESPLISKFCRDYQFHFDSKNFNIDYNGAANDNFRISPMDMFIITYGIEYAFSSLDSCAWIYKQHGDKLFKNLNLKEKDSKYLTGNFKRIDEKIGNFFAKAAPAVEAPPPVVETKTVTVPAAYDEAFTAELNQFAGARKAVDEKIIDDIKNLQLALQEELEAVRGSLKEISDLRDDIDFRTVKAPIEQLLNLIDKLNATLAQHPNENDGKGYDQLIKRCNSFSRYLLQTLGSLGAEVINPVGGEMINPDEHEVFGNASLQAKVVKVNRIGCRYKGFVIRKAEVEVEEPAGGNVQ